jgi:FkbM family methyltransferase
MQFYSQQSEDKFIINKLLKQNQDYSDGVYLECGALDGKLFSNTLTLEKYFGFKGILIEPQLGYYNELLKNRNNKNEFYNCVISNFDDKYLEFISSGSVPGPERGLIKTWGNMGDETRKKYTITGKVNIINRKIKDILGNSQFKYIDIMSIDVEGSEYSFLESIDFTFPIFFIIIEQHWKEKKETIIKVQEFMKLKNYILVHKDDGNEYYANYSVERSNKFNKLEELIL